MTKGERRRARKVVRAEGRAWNVELSESGNPEFVRERTSREEHHHALRMERWARRWMDIDPDWR